MGRRRKKYKKVVKRVRRIPKIFQCPNCGSRTLTIRFRKSEVEGMKKAVITCGACGLHYEMNVPEILEAVDVYGKFIDLFEEGSIELEFRKPEEEEISSESP